MPSISERLRRPLDESMLLRLVMAARLVNPKELTGFYARGGGGVLELQKFLSQRGIDIYQLDALKRAYAETPDFGTLLLRRLRNKGADETKLRAVRRALNACETAQLMAIKKGKRAKPIGEMMVELGHIATGDMEVLVDQQGMLPRVRRYADEYRSKASLFGKLGLQDFGKKLTMGRVAAAGLALVLLIVVGFNIWQRGVFSAAGSRDREIFGGKFSTSDTTRHIRMINQHYGNMITELRLRTPQNIENAKHYRTMLDTYFKALEVAGTSVEDQSVQRVKKWYRRLDFDKVFGISATELPQLSLEELEVRLSQ